MFLIRRRGETGPKTLLQAALMVSAGYSTTLHTNPESMPLSRSRSPSFAALPESQAMAGFSLSASSWSTDLAAWRVKRASKGRGHP